MKNSILIITGLLLGVTIPGFAEAAPYTPCVRLTETQEIYQCRRLESIRHIRSVNSEFRKNSRSTILSIKDGYSKELKKIYLTYEKLSSSQRKVYIDELKDRRLAAYLEWYAEEQELLNARRDLRKIIRLPNNKAIRMELVKERGEFLDAKGNVKMTKRTVIENQIEKLRILSNQ